MLAPLGMMFLLLSPAVAPSATLRQGVVRRAGVDVSVWRDDFTRLLIDRGLSDARPDAESLDAAWALLRGGHCAMRLVEKSLEREGLKSRVLFGDPVHDPHAIYDPNRGVIVVSNLPERAYLRAPVNLARILYHEGLHRSEIQLGLRRAGEGGHFHDAGRVAPIIGSLASSLPDLSAEERDCAARVRSDGSLLEADGRLYDAEYASSSQTQAHPTDRRLPPVSNLREDFTLESLEAFRSGIPVEPPERGLKPR